MMSVPPVLTGNHDVDSLVLNSLCFRDQTRCALVCKGWFAVLQPKSVEYKRLYRQFLILLLTESQSCLSQQQQINVVVKSITTKGFSALRFDSSLEVALHPDIKRLAFLMCSPEDADKLLDSDARPSMPSSSDDNSIVAGDVVDDDRHQVPPRVPRLQSLPERLVPLQIRNSARINSSYYPLCVVQVYNCLLPRLLHCETCWWHSLQDHSCLSFSPELAKIVARLPKYSKFCTNVSFPLFVELVLECKDQDRRAENQSSSLETLVGCVTVDELGTTLQDLHLSRIKDTTEEELTSDDEDVVCDNEDSFFR